MIPDFVLLIPFSFSSNATLLSFDRILLEFVLHALIDEPFPYYVKLLRVGLNDAIYISFDALKITYQVSKVVFGFILRMAFTVSIKYRPAIFQIISVNACYYCMFDVHDFDRTRHFSGSSQSTVSGLPVLHRKIRKNVYTHFLIS
jgi:hypothetical protein